jgi:hypothetical protein
LLIGERVEHELAPQPGGVDRQPGVARTKSGPDLGRAVASATGRFTQWLRSRSTRRAPRHQNRVSTALWDLAVAIAIAR